MSQNIAVLAAVDRRLFFTFAWYVGLSNDLVFPFVFRWVAAADVLLFRKEMFTGIYIPF